jgi:hypothetical protein
MDISNPLDLVSRSTLFKSALIISIAWLLIGLNLSGYEETRRQNDVLCLGCLALEPVADDFEDFWVEHPDDNKVPKHPQWVKDELADNKVVFIYLWSQGCVPCEEQWEDMKDEGLVKGTEDDGEMAKYTSDVVLYSLDAGSEERGKEAIQIYDPNQGSHGTPTSIFLTMVDPEEGGDGSTIYWWAGEGKLTPGDVDDVLNRAMEK